jgi:hypothetical protein
MLRREFTHSVNEVAFGFMVGCSREREEPGVFQRTSESHPEIPPPPTLRAPAAWCDVDAFDNDDGVS